MNARYKFVEKERKILCILTDITEKRELQQELERERQNLKTAVNAVVNFRTLKKTLQDMKNFFNYELYEKLDDTNVAACIDELFRNLHTFKGLFGCWGFKNTAMALHNAENELEHLEQNNTLKTKESLFKFIAGIDVYTLLEKDLKTIECILGKSFFNQEEVVSVPFRALIRLREGVRVHFPDGEEKEGLIQEIEKNMFVSLKKLLATYREHVIELCKANLKMIESFEIIGEDILLEEELYHDFCKALIHLFRNIVYHGIESPEERIIKAKSQGGSIRCVLAKNKDSFFLLISDDGNGVDVEALRRRAVEKGIYSESEARCLSRQQSLELVFAKNISTEQEARQIAGRGVGMSALRNEIEKLGGRILVDSKPDLFTSFSISLPLGSRTDEDTSDYSL